MAEEKKFYKKKPFLIGAGIALLILIIALGANDEQSKKNEEINKKEEKAIPTMFYEQGVTIDQKGSVLNLEIPFKDGNANWPLKHPVEGILKVKLNWSGAGVPDNKKSSISYQVKEKDFDCGGVYCKAKLILDIPGAYTKASWLDIDMSFKPENGESFRMTKRTMVLNR